MRARVENPGDRRATLADMTTAVDELSAALKGARVGQTSVRDVRTRIDLNAAGEYGLFVRFVLENPLAETWPIDDLWELRKRVREHLADRDPGFGMPWYISFEPESEEWPADDGANAIEASL